MNTLGEQQNTSSKSYSFFWGNEVTSEPRDGSLIFGGYDEALIDGPNVTAPYVSDSQQCKEGLIVSLTSLDLQSGGSTKNAWEGMQDLKVCVIASTSAIMFIPEAYYAPIESIMGFKRLALKNGTSSGYFYNTTILDPASL